MPTADPYIRKAHLIRVVDGDTLDLVCDLGYDVKTTRRMRLAGIDCEELHRGDADARAAAERARKALLAELQGAELIVRSEKADSFGRYVAEVWVAGKATSVNQRMLDLGLAVPWPRKGGA